MEEKQKKNQRSMCSSMKAIIRVPIRSIFGRFTSIGSRLGLISMTASSLEQPSDVVDETVTRGNRKSHNYKVWWT